MVASAAAGACHKLAMRRGPVTIAVEPAFYREQAQLSRELAERTDDPEISLHLLSVAKQYDKLADEAERGGR